MSFLHFFKKPEYYFSPITIIKRLFFRKKKGVAIGTLPWGSKIEINNQETIGKAISKTGI